MCEIATSLFNRNSLIYGSTVPLKNEGPACVDRQGENIDLVVDSQPDEAPILAVREK